MILPPETLHSLRVLFEVPPRYLLVVSNAHTSPEQIDAYMYGPATVSQVYTYDRHKFFVCIVTEHYAEAIVDRLFSGLHAARIFKSWDDAYSAISEYTY